MNKGSQAQARRERSRTDKVVRVADDVWEHAMKQSIEWRVTLFEILDDALRGAFKLPPREAK